MLKISNESISEILGIKEKYSNMLDIYDKSNIKYYKTFRSTKDSIDYPSVISLESMDSDDFFASLATYYDGFIPLSNTIHIMNDYTYSLFDNFSKKKLIDYKNSNFIFNRLIGTMIGETYTARKVLKNKGSIADYSQARNSFVFFIARSLHLYGNNFDSNLLRFLWNKLTENFKLEYSEPVVETAIFIKNLLTRNLNKNSFIDLNLADILYLLSKSPNKEIKNNFLKQIINIYPGLENIVHEISGPYDNRMNVFLEIISIIEQYSNNFRLNEMVIAFFCNEISPGSYSHYSILKDLEFKYPAALIWYGFFSSISNDSNNFSSNIFVKLKRDLMAPFSFEDRPVCDISIDEYEVLSRTNLSNFSLNLLSTNSINVSLIPGVDINIKLNNKGIDSSSHILNEQVLRLLKEATMLLDVKHNHLKKIR